MNNCHNSAKALVVMGMHRSGTSALAGLLNQFGVAMGSFLMAAQQDVNEKGFWEQEQVVSVHERLLQYYGLSWDDPRHLPKDWWLEEFPQQCLEEICSIIADDMKANSLWAIKDPRMCRLMPLWRLVFSRLNIEPFFLCIVRNPLEVAASLHVRDGMAKDVAVLLWLQHNLEAVDGTMGYRRRFIGYTQLLNQGDHFLKEIVQEFSIDIDSSPTDSRNDPFLSTGLRHHSISDAALDSDASIPGIVSAFYRMLISAAESGVDLEERDWRAIKRQYQDSAQLMVPWLKLSDKLQRDIANKNVAFEHLHRENELVTQALRTAEQTINNNHKASNLVHAALKEAQRLVREREARVLELDVALKEAQRLVREKEAQELELDRALREAQQLVRYKEARELELDVALKEAQRLVRERTAENAKLDKALAAANTYVREREKDLANLMGKVKE